MWKAAARLLSYSALSTTTLPDFQRSVVLPNISRLSSALHTLAEKQRDEELLVLCLESLTEIVRVFPTSHRSMTDPLSRLCLRILDGSTRSTPSSIASAASRLYASLHVTGGKVGGSALWRKGVDETIVFVRKALGNLRTSYAVEGESSSIDCKFVLLDLKGIPPSSNDPLSSVSLELDRLRCGVELLCRFLQSVEFFCRSDVKPYSA